MKTYDEKLGKLLDAVVDLQGIETENITNAEEQIAKTQNPFTKAMMKVLRAEAKKRCMLHGMISDSLKKEITLNPDELSALSDLFNRSIDAEEKALLLAKELLDESELPVQRFLISYLINDLKKGNELISQFEDELKSASISTSITSKAFGKSKVA